MPGPFTSYTDIFGGGVVSPSQSSLLIVNLTADNSPFILTWPLIGIETAQIASNKIQVSANEAGLSIQMPDATQVSIGQEILFTNTGEEAFNVLNAEGNLIAVVPEADGSEDPPLTGQVFMYLTDNTTEGGTWTVTGFGSVTGEVQASQLAGYGIAVDNITGKLDTSIDVTLVAGPVYDVKPTTLLPDLSDRAKYIIWNSGSGTINFPPVALAGADFQFSIGNQNSDGAAITLQTPDGALIDGNNSVLMTLSQNATYATDGLNWYSLGLGQLSYFQANVLVKDLSPFGGGTVTLSSTEASRNIATFVTNSLPLTSNITILYPATPNFYFITNDVFDNGFTVSISADGGSVVTPVPNGETAIFFNNGTDMIPAPTSVAIGSIIFPNGTAALPSIRFAADPSTGLYSPGVGKIGFTVASTQTAEIDAGGLILYPNGSAANPPISWNSAPTTGFYYAGSGSVGFTSGGVDSVYLDNSGVLTVAGTAANPSYTFLADTNTGMYSVSANIVGLSTDGALRMAVTNTSVELINGTDLVFEESGGANTLTLSVGAMTGDTTYVLPTDYPSVSGQVLSCTDAGVMSWQDNNVTNISLDDGSAANPSLSFVNYPDMGLYVQSSDVIGFSILGNEVSSLSDVGISLFEGRSLFFWNPANTFATGLSNGASLLDLDFTLPLTYPTVNGQPMVSTTTGTMSWATSSFDANGIKVPNGSAGFPSLSFTSETNSGLYRSSAGTFVFSVGGTIVFAINNIGLSIQANRRLSFTNPAGTFFTSLLSGATVADSTYTLPLTYPTVNGQPMVSTTTGTMSWATTSFGADSITIPNGAASITHETPAAPAANYTYIWPADAPVAGDALRVLSVVGTDVTLEWAP